MFGFWDSGRFGRRTWCRRRWCRLWREPEEALINLCSSTCTRSLFPRSRSHGYCSWCDFTVGFHHVQGLDKYFNLIAATIEYIANLNHGRWPAGLVAGVIMLASTSPNRCGDHRSDESTRRRRIPTFELSRGILFYFFKKISFMLLQKKKKRNH